MHVLDYMYLPERQITLGFVYVWEVFVTAPKGTDDSPFLESICIKLYVLVFLDKLINI